MGVFLSGEGVCVVEFLEDVFEPLFFVLPGVSVESFDSYFKGGLTLGRFFFLHLMVLVLTSFSNSLFAPDSRIAVRTAFPQVSGLFSGSWSSESVFFRSEVSGFVDRFASVGFDLHEEGVGLGCYSFLEDLYYFCY